MDINPLEFMKNLQNMQGKMGDMQGKLKTIEVDGNSGGGIVQLKLNGEMKMTSIKIDPIAVDPRDVVMLEELIVSAFTDAQNKMKIKLKDEMSGLTGMPMPDGFPQF